MFLRMKPYQQWAKRLRLHYGVLGIGDDEIKRSAVARVIIGLAREDEDLDAASLHNRAVAAFSGAVHAVQQRDLEGASHGGGSSQKLAAALVRPEAIP